MPDRYHHGDLPNALRAAAAEVIAEHGVGSFSLREVARRAGVSHAAPAHHFGDMTGLLTSLAIQAFEVLHDAMASAAAGIDDPAERLAAIGRAYVATAEEHPGHCEIVFRLDLVDGHDPEYIAAGDRAYGVLEDTVRAVADRYNPGLDITEASNLCWSAMQGLVVLHPNIVRIGELADRSTPDRQTIATRFTSLLLSGLTAGQGSAPLGRLPS
jgi:AcrR family transcriptional regulator